MKRFLLLVVLLVALVGVVSADTLIVYANYNRQLLNNPAGSTATFYEIRNGGGTSSLANATGWRNNVYWAGNATASTYDYEYRPAYAYSTSTIPDDASISSAVSSQWVSARSSAIGVFNLSIIDFTPLSGDSFVAGDFDATTFTRMAEDIYYPAGGAYANQSFTPAGILAINKFGITTLMLALNNTVDNTSFSVGSGTSYVLLGSIGYAYPPYLTIEYTVPDTTPPSSITSLANQSLSCNTVDFSWTNPTDADYGGLMVWRNNTALSNLPNTSTYVNWTGLPGDADITFSSKTVDLLGNINATFVNMTAHTTVCPSPTRTISPTLAPDTCDVEIPWCYTQNVFFWNIPSADVSGYQVLENYPELNNTAYQKVSVSSATGSQYLGRWVVPLGTFTETKTIAPGLWRFRTYHNVSSQVGVSTVEFKVFNRSASGNETDLFYGLSITKDVNELTPTEYLTSYARRNYTTFYPGDRLVIKMNASTTSVTARDVWISTAGNTQASMVETGWFVCCDDGSCACGTGGSGGEAVGAAFGIIGGVLGAIIIFRRRGEMQ